MRNVERICIQDVLVCFLPSSVINIQQFWKALKGTAQLLRIKKESMFIGINSNNSLLLFFFFPIHNINYPSRTQGGGVSKSWSLSAVPTIIFTPSPSIPLTGWIQIHSICYDQTSTWKYSPTASLTQSRNTSLMYL